eukprot:augustus_masked-scaffold_19-processed-gene-3.4-mRNA-1 protein AED:0.03 eAED:0.03 QI:0/-1/0/1/-1/1/1/0/271
MLKQKKIDWKETNVALIGSDWDKDARLDSAETETAWDGCGEEPELKIWRIEQFKVKHWPKKKYGKFHTGDSYIVLHTTKHADTSKLLYDIYFWIGSESSQDEYGVAAYKTVELDAKFRDAAIQHREVQFHESAEFKSVLEQHEFELEYLEGGVETGFTKVADLPKDKKPELFRVKGVKNQIEFKPVKCRRDYMNSGDVFVLDDGFVCWVWVGKDSSSKERGQGMAKAMKYIEEKDRPNYMPIKQIREGTESPLFSENFHNEAKPLCVPFSF